jgi:hypothetical protein
MSGEIVRYTGGPSDAEEAINVMMARLFAVEPERPTNKDDSDKVRFDLLPWNAVEEIAKVLSYGAKKYSDNGWKRVPNFRARYLAAMLRHVVAYGKSRVLGDVLDNETSLHHLAHAACCAMFLIEGDLNNMRVNGVVR